MRKRSTFFYDTFGIVQRESEPKCSAKAWNLAKMSTVNLVLRIAYVGYYYAAVRLAGI